MRTVGRSLTMRVLGLAVIGGPVALFGFAGLAAVLLASAGLGLLIGYLTLTGVNPAVHRLQAGLQEDRRVTAAVSMICDRAQMPLPRCGAVERVRADRFQASAVRRPTPGMVVITRSLLDDLDENELTAVLAHELAHIWHPIRGQLVIACAWGVLGGLVTEIGYAFALFGPHMRSAAFVYSPLGLVLLAVFARPLLALVPFAVARHGEFTADRWACKLGCDGACLATGLWELTAQRARQQANSPRGSRSALERARRIRAILTRGRRSWTATQRRDALIRLCRSDLAVEDLAQRLFSTHPSVTRRTRRLLTSTDS